MCTAVSWRSREHYFGRNLDLEYSYDEGVTIIPRNCFLPFRGVSALPRHHALIGVACLREGYPLYYDAVNEYGLCMAGLNFPGYAVYHPYRLGADNITPFELIPWVLGQCKTAADGVSLLEKTNLFRQDFSPELPLTPMHWLLADGERAVGVESMADGLHLTDDPVGVLTNSPPLDYHLTHLRQYRGLTAEAGEDTFSDSMELPAFSRGMGAMGLPGDVSSTSRFVRAAFVRENAAAAEGEAGSISQFFHILGSVSQTKGCVRLGDGKLERTVYSSCCNTRRGLYCYTTYENSRVTCVDLRREDMEGREPVVYPLRREPDFRWENGSGFCRTAAERKES